MKEFFERLAAGGVLVADGAMGTMLMEHGLDAGQPPESFNLKRRDVLERIAKEYLDAGADIIQTNTFGASRVKLSQYGLDENVVEINRNAVAAVKRVSSGKAYVSGSCGPSGRLLKPYGDVDPKTMVDAFREQAGVLIDAGVDVICIETMTDLQEAIYAIKGVRRMSSSIPVLATMTFDPTPKGFRTVMGVSIEEAAKGLEIAGADVVGSNCGNGIEHMILIAREFKRYTKLPVMIQSNAGKPVLQADKVVYPETPEFMAEKAGELIAIGVSIIGGCCGTTPAHIRALRKAVDARGRAGNLSQD
ncbi:MAG: homocysteine S-methyltransferase family protein [candidate division WOR-3 bacterium]|jgi:5-methyltetrahydrofolate--homocysteine methyltransferase